jgi:hypothetical protein
VLRNVSFAKQRYGGQIRRNANGFLTISRWVHNCKSKSKDKNGNGNNDLSAKVLLKRLESIGIIIDLEKLRNMK